MVWNVLWMAAMAAASALAGFCMGRLSMQPRELYEEAAGVQAAQPGGETEGREGTGRERPWNVQSGFLRAQTAQLHQTAQTAQSRQTAQTAQMDQPYQTPQTAQLHQTPQTDQPYQAAQTAQLHQTPQTDQSYQTTQTTQTAQMWQTPQPRQTAQPNQTSQTPQMPQTPQTPQTPQIPDWLLWRFSVRDKKRRPLRRMGRGRGPQTPQGPVWTVGSPVCGWLTSLGEGEHPMVLIQPLEEKLYAPAAGKIIRLFPMGNAFLLETEFKTQLLIQVCHIEDDLLGRYFRPRVVQNEIVGKGKLLLEFDLQGLLSEGAATSVMVRVESCGYSHSVRLTAGERLKPGEEILQVAGPPR